MASTLADVFVSGDVVTILVIILLVLLILVVVRRI